MVFTVSGNKNGFVVKNLCFTFKTQKESPDKTMKYLYSTACLLRSATSSGVNIQNSLTGNNKRLQTCNSLSKYKLNSGHIVKPYELIELNVNAKKTIKR